jgi:hypothetical protein
MRQVIARLVDRPGVSQDDQLYRYLTAYVLLQNGFSDALEEVSRQSTARPRMYAYHGSFDSVHRGNACIRCRMRKMKCDANKDGCYNCTKARQDCHYDSSVPSSKAGSKMKALEAKIGELTITLQNRRQYPSS